VRGGGRPGVVARLARAGGSIRKAITLATIVSLLLIVPTLMVPQIVKLFGNSIAGSGGLTAQVAVAGLLIAALVEWTLLYTQGALSVRMATKISVRLSSAMVDRLLKLPAAFHAQRGAAVMSQRALVADQLSNSVSAVLVSIAAGLLTATIGSVVLLVVNPMAGAVALIMALLTAWAVRSTLIRSRDLAARVVVERVEAGAVIAASLSQMESIKASGSEDGIIARGLAAQNRLLAAQQRIGVRSLVLKILPGTLGALSTVLVALVAALQVLQGVISPGAFLAVLALSAVVIGPIGQIVVALDQAQTLRASLDQVDDVLDSPPDIEFTHMVEGEVPAVIRGDLELINVSFGYSRLAEPVVADLNLHIPPGHRVALVGPSGCGKSTVSRLVTGLYAPWAGEVLIDSRGRLEHSRAVLSDRLALVDQDVSIFAGTIRENVTLWDPTIPEEDVLSAIRDAQLEEDVARRPGALDAVLDEGGADLSGGQRQRLEIARALVRNPSLLVMDEATSALDPITEQRIDEAVRRRGISCLVIAHRLSTIRDSDEIIVMSKGRIVERGTHDELLGAGGHYADLVGST
jgi:ABC-type branched-subunit amino acid transport system ATPase component